MWQAMQQALQREVTLALRPITQCAVPLLFAALVMTLLHFAVPTEQAVVLLPRLYAVVFLLAVFLLPESWFKPDRASGYLHQYALSPLGFGLAVSIRLLVRIALVAPALIVLLGAAAWAMGVPSAVVQAQMLGMLLGVPTLFLCAALSAALTVKLKESTLLTIVILMPFYTAPLLLMEWWVMQAQAGLPAVLSVYGLAGLACLSLAGLPWAITGVLHESLG